MDEYETIEREGFTGKIYYDEIGAEHADPRGWDNVSTMVCWHPSYILGDYQVTDGDGRGAIGGRPGHDTRFHRDDFKSMRHLHRYLGIAEGAVGILPLYLYDHSGISISAGSRNPFDSGGWDTSMVGFVYTTRDRIRELCGDGDEYQTEQWILNAMRSDVQQYDLYLTGQVFCYTIANAHGDIIDSCGGFLGFDHCKETVEEELNGYVARRAATVEQGMHQWRYIAALAGGR